MDSLKLWATSPCFSLSYSSLTVCNRPVFWFLLSTEGHFWHFEGGKEQGSAYIRKEKVLNETKKRITETKDEAFVSRSNINCNVKWIYTLQKWTNQIG